MSLNKHVAHATDNAAAYHEGPTETHGDVCMHFRYFTYGTKTGLVSGIEANVMFTIDRPAKDVWPYFKDFNLWMNSYGYYWSGVVGDLYSREARDLGEETIYLKIDKPDDPAQKSQAFAYEYRVLRVVPERMTVVFQPAPEDGSTGGVSPGFHVDMLNERDGKTILTLLMEHAFRTKDKTEEEALDFWRERTQEYMRAWREDFIPNLKRLVHEGK